MAQIEETEEILATSETGVTIVIIATHVYDVTYNPPPIGTRKRFVSTSYRTSDGRRVTSVDGMVFIVEGAEEKYYRKP